MVGVTDRSTGQVSVEVANSTDKETLQGVIRKNTKQGTKVFTDEHRSYTGMVDVGHKSVKHGVGEYVNVQAHTNGIDSFWSLLKRSYRGTYHQMSVKHLGRYVADFRGRHNIRDMWTEEQMRFLARMMAGATLSMKELIGRKAG